MGVLMPATSIDRRPRQPPLPQIPPTPRLPASTEGKGRGCRRGGGCRVLPSSRGSLAMTLFGLRNHDSCRRLRSPHQPPQAAGPCVPTLSRALHTRRHPHNSEAFATSTHPRLLPLFLSARGTAAAEESNSVRRSARRSERQKAPSAADGTGEPIRREKRRGWALWVGG